MRVPGFGSWLDGKLFGFFSFDPAKPLNQVCLGRKVALGADQSGDPWKVGAVRGLGQRKARCLKFLIAQARLDIELVKQNICGCSVASGVLGDEIAYQPNPPRAAVLVGRDAFVKML
jgi:hypothetical protein